MWSCTGYIPSNLSKVPTGLSKKKEDFGLWQTRKQLKTKERRTRPAGYVAASLEVPLRTVMQQAQQVYVTMEKIEQPVLQLGEHKLHEAPPIQSFNRVSFDILKKIFKALRLRRAAGSRKNNSTKVSVLANN